MPARQSPMPPAVIPRKALSSPSTQVPRPGEAVSTPVARRQEERDARIVALASRAGQESGSRPGSLLLVAEPEKSLARDRSCMKGYTARDSLDGGFIPARRCCAAELSSGRRGMTYICICQRSDGVTPDPVVVLRHRHGSYDGDQLHSTLSARLSEGGLPIFGHHQ